MDWSMGPKDADDVANAIWGILDPIEGSSQLLRLYFDPAGDFSGAWFEKLGAGIHAANEIGCHDLLAVTMLGVREPGLLTRDLVRDDSPLKSEVFSRLQQIDDEDLWTADVASLEKANDLWNVLRDHADGLGEEVGDARISKLLARKRPNLIPISDKVVRDTIHLPRGRKNRWAAYRSALVRRDGDILQRLKDLRSRVPMAKDASLLRVLDAIVWISGSPSKAAKAARERASSPG